VRGARPAEVGAVGRSRPAPGERSDDPAAEARSGTNLFVRYESKGGATLEDAHDGAVDRDALRENLRIEHHTSFETDGLAVDGRPYEEFLEDTIEHGFTRWLVEDLPFEVSSTGNQSVLRDLYDAIPEIDRAEIGGSVSIVIRENGEGDPRAALVRSGVARPDGEPAVRRRPERQPRPDRRGGHWSRLSRTVATSPSRTSRSPRRSR